MDSSNRYPSHQNSNNYAPSAPSLPENYDHQPNPPPRFTAQQSFSFSSSHNPHPQPHYPQPHHQPSSPPYDGYGYGYGYGYGAPPPSYGGGGFPPGTHPEIIRSFQMVDKDGSGYIDERELQEALSFGYHSFSLRTIRLIMFLFANPTTHSLKIGPKEFSALWRCIGEWRAIFERFDRDRSGKIDTLELRDALYSLGYAVPPSVLQVLISKYEDGSGRRGELNFDSFVECGMIVKGLTEKFKEKDTRYTGSATLNYDTFMSMVIPFIVP